MKIPIVIILHVAVWTYVFSAWGAGGCQHGHGEPCNSRCTPLNYGTPSRKYGGLSSSTQETLHVLEGIQRRVGQNTQDSVENFDPVEIFDPVGNEKNKRQRSSRSGDNIYPGQDQNLYNFGPGSSQELSGGANPNSSPNNGLSTSSSGNTASFNGSTWSPNGRFPVGPDGSFTNEDIENLRDLYKPQYIQRSDGEWVLDERPLAYRNPTTWVEGPDGNMYLDEKALRQQYGPGAFVTERYSEPVERFIPRPPDYFAPNTDNQAYQDYVRRQKGSTYPDESFIGFLAHMHSNEVVSAGQDVGRNFDRIQNLLKENSERISRTTLKAIEDYYVSEKLGRTPGQPNDAVNMSQYEALIAYGKERPPVEIHWTGGEDVVYAERKIAERGGFENAFGYGDYDVPLVTPDGYWLDSGVAAGGGVFNDEEYAKMAADPAQDDLRHAALGIIVQTEKLLFKNRQEWKYGDDIPSEHKNQLIDRSEEELMKLENSSAFGAGHSLTQEERKVLYPNGK